MQTSSQTRTKPDPGEIEVSVFGPGFGECIVVHFGRGRWLIVDSCMNRTAKKAAALAYFEQIGVDASSDVELVLITHWHDDHVRGVDQLARECKHAKFWVSDALQSAEFLALFNRRFARPDLKFPRGAEAMSALVDAVGSSVNFAQAGLRIFQSEVSTSIGVLPIQMWALSPSSYENYLGKQQIAELATRRPPPRRSKKPQLRLPERNPNHTAVALAVMIGNEHLLLGADLEKV